ncbi:flagellar assembly protein FliW [Clostridium butyricum]|uniref:flagellar assembly protein FliW n=1 Tax=Clostridium butyricum TaxID=1492 RepID=UPI00374EC9FB
MKFTSKIHGEINYTEENIITFKKGIPGFEKIKKYILVDLKGCEPFCLLQSLESENVGMIVVSPYDFFKEYKIKLSDETVKALEIKSPEEVYIITTVTLNSDPKKITTNLQGPIIINNSKKLGEQIILDNCKYKVKELLMKE